MSTASHTSIVIQSMISNGIYNLDSTRFTKASLDTRSEGWTEIWGGKEEQQSKEEEESKENSDDTNKPVVPAERIVLVFEDTTNSMWAEVDDPSINVLLTQYRPAWLEQMVLKMANIPYIVVNSTHHCNEATGQLPYLTDYSACSSTSNQQQQQQQSKQQQSKLPMLIGRNHPSNLIERHHKNSILTYLKEYRNVDIDEMGLTTDHQRALSQSFLTLIQTDLQNCLLYLRYEDHDAWEQVYRKQYIQASCPKHHYYYYHQQQQQGKGTDVTVNWFLQLRGRYQAMTERTVERRRLIEYTRNSMNIDDVVERAKDAFQALERQLIAAANQDTTTTSKEKYLLGTDRPAFVDAVLFAHLADALCDVHLVVVLSSYPNLVQYFQDMYQKYFSTTQKTKTNKRSVSCWDEWNERQNVENAFQQIPILAENQISKYSTFKDAIDLMHSLSLQKQELKEVLGAIKAKRDDEGWPEHRKYTDSLLYRWCMGGDMEKVSSKTPAEKEENPIRKKLLRDQIRNDQRWISGVAAASLVAVLLLQAGGSND